MLITLWVEFPLDKIDWGKSNFIFVVFGRIFPIFKNIKVDIDRKIQE